MFSAFQTFGRLGAGARAVSAAWSPLALWPLGASSPGLWIDPPYTASLFSTSAGTTPISAIGTVLDTSNPVGLVLDRKGGATTPAGPGIHLSQATATSRPVASARVNLLTKTEDLSDAAWGKSGGATVTPGAIAPDGSATAFDVTFTTGSAGSQLFGTSITTIAAPSKQRVYLRSATGVNIFYGAYDGGGAGVSGGNITLTSTWTAYDVSLPAFTGADRRPIWLYSTAAGQQFQIWHPQLNLGSTALPYQRVGAASDYDASAGPTYLKFDGVDDGLATATFSAGTLTSSMDCLMAVRRDSAGNAVVGLYESVAEANKVFGIAESGSASGAVGSGAGTPTVWVDGVQLTGGTAVTRGTLHTALSAGSWHILELRGLDLSTWTAAGFGKYTSYILNGALGETLLFPSGQDANRDLARAEMASYFGVTLP